MPISNIMSRRCLHPEKSFFFTHLAYKFNLENLTFKFYLNCIVSFGWGCEDAPDYWVSFFTMQVGLDARTCEDIDMYYNSLLQSINPIAHTFVRRVCPKTMYFIIFHFFLIHFSKIRYTLNSLFWNTRRWNVSSKVSGSRGQSPLREF